MKIVEIAPCYVKETFQNLSPNFTIGERLDAKNKMSVRALNSQDVGKNIKVGFFSKENAATRCMA